MAGHVFLTRGDLTRLSCDAWLLPTDARFSVKSHWRAGVEPQLADLLRRLRLRQLSGVDPSPPAAWFSGALRVLAVAPWLNRADVPRPYLVNVGAHTGKEISWYIDGVRAFFKLVAADLPQRPPLNKRARRLIALPLIGTGSGGKAKEKGKVVRSLLPALYEAAANHDFDVVLVTANREAFIAAQNERRRYLSELPEGSAVVGWSELNARLRDAASRLARDAIAGSLVLFIGAGVSLGAGLPNWSTLLDELAQDAGMDDPEREALGKLDVLDRARIVRSRLDRRQDPAARGRRDTCPGTALLARSLPPGLPPCL